MIHTFICLYIVVWLSVLFVYFSYYLVFVPGYLPTLAIIPVWIGLSIIPVWIGLYKALSNVADEVAVCFKFSQVTFCLTSKFAAKR